MSYFLVFLGGGFGSSLRYAFSIFFPSTDFIPIATLGANFFASFILGVLLVMFPIQSNSKLLLATGFCGGFSTFSTFSAETLLLIQQGHILSGITNIVLNLLLCIIAVALGVWLAGK